MQCRKDKAPEPDGFDMNFLHKFLYLMKENIFEFFKEFHEFESFVRCVNSSFVILISKVKE